MEWRRASWDISGTHCPDSASPADDTFPVRTRLPSLHHKIVEKHDSLLLSLTDRGSRSGRAYVSINHRLRNANMMLTEKQLLSLIQQQSFFVCVLSFSKLVITFCTWNLCVWGGGGVSVCVCVYLGHISMDTSGGKHQLKQMSVPMRSDHQSPYWCGNTLKTPRWSGPKDLPMLGG